MKISVIVPVYNTARYLPKCLDSIINQSYKDLEIILIDDGSPDNAPVICDEYAKKDSRIKVIHKQNEGLSSAVKTGILKATGEYIGFVDSDDSISVDMFDKLTGAAFKHEADLVQCNYYLEFENGKTEKVIHSDSETRFNENENILLAKQMLTNFEYKKPLFGNNRWNKLIRTELLKKNLEYYRGNIKIGEDLNCIFPALLDCKSVVLIPDCLYFYYQNAQSMTKGFKATLYSDYINVIEVLRQIAHDKNCYNDLEMAINKREYAYKLSCIRNFHYSRLSKKERVAEIKKIHQSTKKIKIKQVNKMQNIQRLCLEFILALRLYFLL